MVLLFCSKIHDYMTNFSNYPNEIHFKIKFFIIVDARVLYGSKKL